MYQTSTNNIQRVSSNTIHLKRWACWLLTTSQFAYTGLPGPPLSHQQAEIVLIETLRN